MIAHTSPSRRKDEYAESTRQALLVAAKEAFASNGFLATSIDDITEIARVTKGALYHHFRDKRAIFDAVVVAVEDSVAIYVEQQVKLERLPEKRFIAGLTAYLTACADPTFRRLVIQDAASVLGMQRFREIDEASADRLMIAPLLAMQKAGSIVCEDVRFLGHILSGILWESVLLLPKARNKSLHKQLAIDMVCRLLDSYKVD